MKAECQLTFLTLRRSFQEQSDSFTHPYQSVCCIEITLFLNSRDIEGNFWQAFKNLTCFTLISMKLKVVTELKRTSRYQNLPLYASQDALRAVVAGVGFAVVPLFQWLWLLWIQTVMAAMEKTLQLCHVVQMRFAFIRVV